MKLTLDANIWVSAFQFKGVAQRILDLADARAVDLVTSEAIIEEVLDVLGRKFDWSIPELKLARKEMTRCAEVVKPTVTITEVAEDPDDDRILECAVESGSDMILSGDKDLLRRGQYHSIKIVSPTQFLEQSRGR